jgi:hypothetical protein
MRLVVATHGIWADDQLGWRKNRIRQFGVDGMRIGAGASVILARERMAEFWNRIQRPALRWTAGQEQHRDGESTNEKKKMKAQLC